jgi:hypothetical protein
MKSQTPSSEERMVPDCGAGPRAGPGLAVAAVAARGTEASASAAALAVSILRRVNAAGGTAESAGALEECGRESITFVPLAEVFVGERYGAGLRLTPTEVVTRRPDR